MDAANLPKHDLVMQDPWNILENVKDPEVPVLSIVDLGIVREVHAQDDKHIEVVITPTYSGCPAMDVIGSNVKTSLRKAGYEEVKVKLVLSPAWTTDWLSEDGKRKLEEYGIAPPVGATTDKRVLMGEYEAVRCPQCKSTHTKMISRFGSTACKALFQCESCLEPFDYFKCH